MIRILQIGPDDWNVYRDVRLEGLQESPHALGNRYENEKKGSEQDWRTFVQACRRLVAFLDDVPCGTISVCDGDASATAALTTLWVRPTARCLGVGDALVLAALELATANGFKDIELCVEDSSEAAIRLYCRKGFKPTGKRCSSGWEMYRRL